MPDYSIDLMAARKALVDCEVAVNRHDFSEALRLVSDAAIHVENIRVWCAAQQARC